MAFSSNLFWGTPRAAPTSSTQSCNPDRWRPGRRGGSDCRRARGSTADRRRRNCYAGSPRVLFSWSAIAPAGKLDQIGVIPRVIGELNLTGIDQGPQGISVDRPRRVGGSHKKRETEAGISGELNPRCDHPSVATTSSTVSAIAPSGPGSHFSVCGPIGFIGSGGSGTSTPGRIGTAPAAPSPIATPPSAAAVPAPASSKSVVCPSLPFEILPARRHRQQIDHSI